MLRMMDNNEEWCEKNQARCYVVQALYLEKFEMTMGKMEIEEWKTMIIFLLHLGGKWDVYIESEELNTAKFDKPGVGIKKMVTKN